MWTAQLQNKRQTLEMFPKLKKINRLKKMIKEKRLWRHLCVLETTEHTDTG